MGAFYVYWWTMLSVVYWTNYTYVFGRADWFQSYVVLIWTNSVFACVNIKLGVFQEYKMGVNFELYSKNMQA